MAGTDTQQFIPLGYGDPVPEPFFDATQEVLGTLGRLDLTLANATTIRALAGAGGDESGMGVAGALRWVTANVDRVMPGASAAGRYDVYVTTGPTSIAPGDPPTDTTDYTWALGIVASGAAAPAGAGIAYTKRVGYLDWSGTAITRLVQTFGRRDDAPRAAVSPTTDVTPLEAIAPAGQTAPLLRASVGGAEVFRVNPDGTTTLTARQTAPTMTLTGAGPAVLTLSDAGGGLTIGGDVNLYRSAANVLRTDDSLWATGNVAGGVGGAGQATLGGVGPGAAAGVTLNDATLYRGGPNTLTTAALVQLGANLALTTDTGALVFGAAGDVNLYRANATTLKTDDSFAATGAINSRSGLAGQVRLTDTAGDGTGNAEVIFGLAGDTVLYRSAAGTLRTDTALSVGGAVALSGTLNTTALIQATAATGAHLFRAQITGDTGARWLARADGAVYWGDGAGAYDVSISRTAAATATMTGTWLAPTAAAGTSTTQIATTAFVATSFAKLAGPVFTGVPKAPLAAVNDNSSQIATTAYVQQQGGNVLPVADGVAAIGTAVKWARQDHVHPTDTSRAPVAAPTFTGLTTVADLAHTGLLGFYGAAPVGRVAARAQTNWTAGANALRAIDRSAYTLNNLFDYVATLVADLQSYGLLA